MAGDISKIKVGQAPSGLDIKKTITEPTTAPAPIPPPAAPRPAPFQPPQARLGETEKARPLSPPSAPISAPARPLSPQPQIVIPPETPRKVSSTLFLLIALGAAVIGLMYWYFALRTQEPETVLLPTPSAQPSPTPAVKDLRAYFGAEPAAIQLTSEANPMPNFLIRVSTVQMAGGTARKLLITDTASGSAEYTPTGLMDRLLIGYPPELKNILSGEDSIILSFGQQEAFDAKGNFTPQTSVQNRLAMVFQVVEAVAGTTQQALRAWEPTMPSDLSGIFSYDKTKATPKTFADNTYQGTPVRFMNFPWPDRSIDYALINASNGKTYLVISNSRESAFSIIGTLLRN